MKQINQLFVGIISLFCASNCTSQIVSNGDFETPLVPETDAVYSPTNAVWVWTGGGIISPPGNVNGASFEAPTPPVGTQLAFLQGNSNTMSQAVLLPVNGEYIISYQDAGRPLWPSGAAGNTTYQVLLDSNLVAQLSTTTGQPWTPESFTFISTAGQHTLTFQIVSVPYFDETAFFDAIVIEPKVPVLTIMAVEDLPSLEILGPSGTTNTLQFTDTLSATNVWHNLTNIVLTSSPTFIVDLSASNSLERFYRVVQSQ